MIPPLNQATDVSRTVIEYRLNSEEHACLKSKAALVESQTQPSQKIDIESWANLNQIWHDAVQNGSNSKIAEFLAELKNMATLQNNWNGYGSERPNPISRKYAEDILLASFRAPSKIVPSAQGGIGIIFYGPNGKYADIECFNSGEILAATAIGRGNADVWSVSATNIEKTLEKIGTFIAG